MTDLAKLKIDRTKLEEPSGSLGKKITVILVVLGVLATGFYLYTGPLKPAHEVKISTAHSVYPTQATSVLTASGYVVAQRKAEVASKATGKLEVLRVEEGTVVKKGQIIGELESRDMQANLEQAKADLELARATLAEAKANYDRHRLLVEQELVSTAQYDVAKAQYQRAIASVNSAKASVQAAQVALENTYIRAPFDGTVLTKNADVGDIVAPFGSAGNSKGTVVSMADMDSLLVEADVSESNIERITVGQPCEITLDAFPDKRYRGAVHMIVPTADRAKATVMTKVRFLDKDQRVLPEMSAKVAFLTQEMTEQERDAKPILVVSPAGLVDRDGKKVAFIVKEEKVFMKPVTTGKMVGTEVEVLEGLAAGDQVVVNPEPDLENGSKVKISEE